MSGPGRAGRGVALAFASGALAAVLAMAPIGGDNGDPEMAVAAAVASAFRWAGVAAAGHIALTSAVAGLVPFGTRPRGVLRMVTKATPRSLRTLILGSSMAVASAVVPLSPAVARSDRPPPTLVLLEAQPDSGLDPAVTQPPPVPSPPAASSWTVRPGEHFWSIAATLAAQALERPPTIEEVTRRWVSLIEQNRHNLIDRDNPDLLLPGQILQVGAP